jgi:hypothetical protein
MNSLKTYKMKVFNVVSFFCGAFIVICLSLSSCSDENTGNGGDDRPGAKTGANAPERQTEEGKVEPAVTDSSHKHEEHK